MHEQPIKPLTSSDRTDLAVLLDQGVLRDTDSLIPEASNDIEAISLWLAQKRSGSLNTYRSYRREAERLLLWCAHVAHKPLASLTVADFNQYEAFLRSPPAAWCRDAGDNRRYRRDDHQWRPFAGPLSERSVRLALTILNGLMQWLTAARYLRGNPLGLLSHPKVDRKARVTRDLPQSHWRTILKAIATMPDTTPSKRFFAAQSRWIMSLAYLTGLRANEIATHQMKHFQREERRDEVQWWLHITGKRGKLRAIPVNSDLLFELHLWRETMALTPEPHPADETPLVCAYDGSSLAYAGIYRRVKLIFRAAAQLADSPHERERLLKASPHWIRHTTATVLLDQTGDLKAVQELLGHESIETAQIYLHQPKDQQHKKMQSLRLPKTS